MERLTEIWLGIRSNKLRTFLTGFSVAWGIFMLVLLLGVGTGLQNGTRDQFKDDAINSIWVNPGQTSISYNGMQPGRKIQFHDQDFDILKAEIQGGEKFTARVDDWAGRSVTYGTKSAQYRLRGVHPEHQFVEKTIMLTGRFINEGDLLKRRKVCVIGQPVETELFGEKSSIGEWVSVGGVPFRVVGTFMDEGSEGENSTIYLPVNTMQLAYGYADKIDRVMFTIGDATLEESQAMVQQVKERMAQRHNFSLEDDRALYVRNNFEEYKRIADVLGMMNKFFWLIGILTIFAGIIGVSNIMLITVQERTREIGIRKAIGAKPLSIILMIVEEAVLITVFFGYFGLFFGVFLLELISKAIPEDGAVFTNPTVDFSTAINALIVLVVAGALSALIPAARASRIKPVEALAAD
ncbi:MAG: FtsX-like permease family protein [Bacteroidetes bacterium]|nr:FtsX-like permease family protein [Bacteroidota bacterium]